ncbi:XRE family transcriptional regulator [Nocardia farcinica]|uniref:XRE family transcriptional regulator n=1 Tax=Nocardia farcinica TaxID=37329 RepID=UPI0018950BD8|nr:XRE family transcriptional regulator [Nocardia farcinica]MBF6584453.1 XRE family transcriptional regulator [Nocardia farcinica]
MADLVCRHIENATGRSTGIDAQAISRIECGEIRWPRVATRQALVALLGTESEAELGLHPKRTRRDCERDDATKRRNFLALGVAAPILATPTSRVGESDIAEARARFTRLQELDNFLGGGDTYRLYLAELSQTEAILQRSTYTPSVGRALTVLAGEQAQQCGWAAFDAGHRNVALGLYEYSRRAADEAGSPELAANALIQIAYATGDRASVAAADAAVHAVGAHAPARARALLESRRAWSRATTGDADGAERALDAARDALEEQDDRRPAWAAWVTPRELDIMTGRVRALLRDPRAAVPLERALASFPDQWARDKALYMAALADARMTVGDTDRAVQDAEQALALAAPVASVRPLARLAQVVARMPEAGDLRSRVAAARPPIPARL